MKYYVIERQYNQKGKLVIESRITGDITDLSWARNQMDHRFNQKMIDYRHEIKPGAVKISSDKCEMNLNGGKYEIEIMKICETLTGREILLALNEKHQGDFYKIYNAIEKKDFADQDLSVYTRNVTNAYVTLLDEAYPTRLKQMRCLPFVLYYKGDLTLLTSRKYKRLAVGIMRECPEQLRLKAHRDLLELSKDIVLITDEPFIIKTIVCSDNKNKPHIIFIKPCGLEKRHARVSLAMEQMIVAQGGLVITPYPDNTEMSMGRCTYKTYLAGNICDGVFVINNNQHSSVNILVNTALTKGQDIMVYPTWPEYGDTINNSLISEGATLIENAADIKEILKK